MNPNIPAILSAAAIRAIPTADTHAVRVIMMSTSGSTQFTLRGMGRRKGKYILERNGATGRHGIDIPVSLWNQGIPEGRYQDNPSIAHDLLSKPSPLTPFITMIVPWEGGTVAPKEDSGAVGSLDAATVILGYFNHIKAPDHVTDIVRQIAANPHEFLQYLEEPTDDEEENPGDTPNPSTQESSTPAAPVAAEPSPPTPPARAQSESAAAIRMREKRARDKAAREAEKQNLQPA